MTATHATNNNTADLFTNIRCQAHHHGKTLGTRHVCGKPATYLLWNESYPVAITVCEAMADLAACDEGFQSEWLPMVQTYVEHGRAFDLSHWVHEWMAWRTR